MIELGKYLKELRNTSQLSLEQAALVTKISKSTLIAIEEADLKQLPAKSYLRGFVFSYGKFLGADTQKLSQLFSQELGSTNPEVSQEDIEKETWKTVPHLDKLQLNSKTYIIIGLVVITAIAITTRQIYQKYKNETIIANQQTSIEESEKELTAATQTIVQKNKASTDLESKNSTDNKNNETTAVNNKAAVLTQDIVKEKKRFPKELLIEAQEDTAVKIKIGDKEEKMVKLLKGDFHTIKAKSLVQLEPTNIRDIRIIYNGTLRTAKKSELKSNILSF